MFGYFVDLSLVVFYLFVGVVEYGFVEVVEMFVCMGYFFIDFIFNFVYVVFD